MVNSMFLGWAISCGIILFAGLFHVFATILMDVFASNWGSAIQGLYLPSLVQFFSGLGDVVFIVGALLIAAFVVAVAIYVVGLPIYAVIFLVTQAFARWFIAKFSPRFEFFALVSYLIFGAPLACIAVYYFYSGYGFPTALFLHMTPFYAFVLIPINIGYIWLITTKANIDAPDVQLS